MKKCCCGKGAYILWVVLIVLFTLMATVNLVFVLGKPSHMSYIGNIEVESKSWAWSCAIVIWSVVGYMCYEFYKSATPRILFDCDKAIFVLSQKDKREFTWAEMTSPKIQIEWRKVRFQPNFLQFNFPRNMAECSELEQLLQSLHILGSHKELLLAKNFVGYKEFEARLIENGVLKRYNMVVGRKRK